MKLLTSTALLLLGLSLPAVAETIDVANSWTSGSEAAAKQVYVDRMKELGYDWNDVAIAGYENSQAAFAASVQAGDAPAAKGMVAGAQGQAYFEAGIMRNIDPLFADGKLEKVLPQLVLQNIKYDGHYYNAPTDVHGQSWYFYSIPAMKKIGVTKQPDNWDDFFAMLDKAKAAGLTPIAWSGQSWQITAVWNQIFLAIVGAQQFNALYTDKDPEVVKTDAFKKAVKVFRHLQDYIGEGTENRSWNDATAMVIRNQALLQFQPDWAKGEFTAAGKKVGVDFGCQVTPGSKDMMVIVDSFTFPKVKGKADAQMALAKVVLDPKIQEEFALKKGAFPVRTDVDMSDFDQCSQTAAHFLQEDKIAPNVAMTLTPNEIGEQKDLLARFWASDMGPEEFGKLLVRAVSD